MPPYGLYSLTDRVNLPEELGARGYFQDVLYDYDPAFGELRTTERYQPAPFTGARPFQALYDISPRTISGGIDFGFDANLFNPSFGGVSGYRNVGGIDTLPELDTSRFADVDLESGYLDRAGSSDQDVYSEKPKSFRDSKTLEEYFQNRSPLQGILQYLPTPFNIVRNILSGEGIRSLNQRLRNTDFGQSKTLQEYLQRREARKDAERLQTVGQQLQQASERGGGYQPTSREQNVARTESRRADKGLGQGGVYGL